MTMTEDIITVRNAYTESSTNMVSAEQMLSLDPDKIILCTLSGYHPPRQLYDDSQYSTLQDLRALREGEVYSLATTQRLKFPINLMIEAKAVS